MPTRRHALSIDSNLGNGKFQESVRYRPKGKVQGMEINSLRSGDKLWLEDGSVVQVLLPSADGQSVRVKYIESPFDEGRVGAEADCTDYDIVSYADEADRADSATPMR